MTHIKDFRYTDIDTCLREFNMWCEKFVLDIEVIGTQMLLSEHYCHLLVTYKYWS